MSTEFERRPPYQQRVIEELREVKEKLRKLEDFIFADRYLTLDKGEQQRLHWQRQIMLMYEDVLTLRIDSFPPP